jgi:hypothetical protein
MLRVRRESAKGPQKVRKRLMVPDGCQRHNCRSATFADASQRSPTVRDEFDTNSDTRHRHLAKIAAHETEAV